MENQTNSVTPMAMSYGLYMGLALILNSVIFYINGTPFAHSSVYITYAILIGGTVWTMKIYRENHQDGGVTYGKALGLGTLQALFASLVFGFFTFVLFTLVDKTLSEKFLSFLEEEFTRSGISESQIDTIMPMYRKFMSPAFYSFSQIFSITFYGFLFSLVVAIFFRKESTNPFHGVE